MHIVFGNPTDKYKYKIYYLLKGQKKQRWYRTENKDSVVKAYKKLLDRNARYIEIWATKPKSIMTNQIAYYCKKRFIDQHDIIREKGNKTLDFKRMQGE